MENTTVLNILEYTGGEINGNVDINAKVSLISNDGRNNAKDWIYLAIKGENLDGHKFIKQAKDNGAICAIVEERTEDSIVVDNTYIALKNIAKEYRNKFSIDYVAVTGSSGKTTTKDMIYFAMNENKKTLRNEGNLNSEIGLPLTILNLDKTYEAAILEMGMYTFGEIDYLADIVRPHIAVITNIGTAHIQNLKTRENILKAKLEISNYLTENDYLLINGDNDLLANVKDGITKANIIRFGIEKENNAIYPIDYKFIKDKTYIKANVVDEIVELEIPTIGEHNVLNALSALGVCKLLNYDLRRSADGLSKYKSSKYRMEKSIVGDKLIINDCYNANPDSMKAAIKTLESFDNRRRILILGDMLELGENSINYHKEIGDFAARYSDFIVAIGDEAKYISDSAIKNGAKSKFFDNKEEAVTFINNLLEKDDVVLIKASRGIRLEEVAEKIC